MSAQGPDILPLSLPPLGVGREQAAALIGITHHVRQIRRGGLRAVATHAWWAFAWDVAELTAAFRRLPHRGGMADYAPALDEGRSAGNPWD